MHRCELLISLTLVILLIYPLYVKASCAMVYKSWTDDGQYSEISDGEYCMLTLLQNKQKKGLNTICPLLKDYGLCIMMNGCSRKYSAIWHFNSLCINYNCTVDDCFIAGASQLEALMLLPFIVTVLLI